MDDDTNPPVVDRPIVVQIQELALAALAGDETFDDASRDRLSRLADAGRLSRVEEVIEALRGDQAIEDP